MSDSFLTLWTVARQTLLSMGFPRQEYWSELPFPSPEDFPNPGIESTSLALAGGFFTAEPWGSPKSPTYKTSSWELSKMGTCPAVLL